MSCLYCGKEIGPLRSLRKEEFCSAVHRRLYRERLGKVLGEIGAPEPAPASLAGFLTRIPPITGPIAPAAYVRELLHAPHAVRTKMEWPVEIPHALGTRAEPAVGALVPAVGAEAYAHVPLRPRYQRVAPVLPRFAVSAASELDRLREVARFTAMALAGPAPVPRAVPVERMRFASMAEQPANCALPASLPRFAVSAELEPLPEPVATPSRPPLVNATMAAPPPVGVARLVASTLAAEERLAVPASAAAPLQKVPPVAEPRLPTCEFLYAVPNAQPALVDAVASHAADVTLMRGLRLPALPAWRAEDQPPMLQTGPVPSPAAVAVESMPSFAVAQPVPLTITPRITCPRPALAAVAGSARLGCSQEPDMAPRPALPAPAATSPVVPMLSVAPALPEAVRPPRPETLEQSGLVPASPEFRLPRASFASLDFHCRPTAGTLSKRVHWIPPTVSMRPPELGVRPIFDRWEDLVPPKTHGASSDLSKKILTMPRVLRQVVESKQTRHMVGSIAAGLFLGAAIWFGTGQARWHRNTLSDADLPGSAAPRADTASRKPPTGLKARIQKAISDRAAASFSESFRTGMEAWGSAPKAYASGWRHSDDGYVQPGPMAIFRPTLDYTDYQVEFFGQIERKSLDWVVRARDAQNYYAMKLTVVEPGLRPIIALARYAVVEGKRSKMVQVPLGVMVHNSHPMQVLVDVKGRNFTASVDGQEVESWSDDAPAMGGVGFFADAGDKARVYWMRVSRNQDFLGRICAYIAGSGRTSAELWPSGPYGFPHSGNPEAPFDVEAAGLAFVVTVRRARARRNVTSPQADDRDRSIRAWRS